MRSLRLVLLSALALLLIPLSATPALAASGTITGVALDSNGKPLPHVGWELYTWEGGEWTTLQFGPKTTDTNGRFSQRVVTGGQYRVCFYDTYYGPAYSAQNTYWQPEIRHRDTCWPNASSWQTAPTWTSTTATPSKTFTVKLPKQGLGMAPVDPFIIGSYQVGQPLTIVGQEGWRPTNASFSYQWMTQQNGSPVAPIPGANAATFVPTAAQSGKWVFASVTASRPGYKPATLTTPMTMVGTVHVQPTTPLKVTGTAKPHATLTASFGKPASTYSELSWFVDGVPQPDFTSYDSASSTFPVTSDHSGARIDARLKMYKFDSQGNYIDGTDTYRRVQVQVSGSRPKQALPVTSAPIGQPTLGRILKAPTGVTADPKATVSYQWLRGSKTIKRATKNRYKVRAADLDKKLKVRVTVNRPGWWNTYVTTSTAKVAKKALKKGRVKVVGKARVGKRLTARATGWGPKQVKIRYQWLRDGRAIRGATKARYKIRKSDRRSAVKVRITVKKAHYLTVTKTSKSRKIKR